MFVCLFCFLFFCIFSDTSDSALHTGIDKAIQRGNKLWGFTFHPGRQNTLSYIPVARLQGDSIWRKVCYPMGEGGAYTRELQTTLCYRFSNQPMELAIQNVSSSEVWLARVRYGFVDEMHIDHGEDMAGVTLAYIVDGNCSTYGTTLLSVQSRQCYSTFQIKYFFLSSKQFYNKHPTILSLFKVQNNIISIYCLINPYLILPVNCDKLCARARVLMCTMHESKVWMHWTRIKIEAS